MLPYTIEDPITVPLSGAVEVTIDFGGGLRRWCFFATPQLLADVGDWLPGTRVRVHLGAMHMIVVSELSEDVVGRVLRHLWEQGLLETHTRAV